MTRGPFDPTFAELPAVLPIFPLGGALLLPGGVLPLNIFEPRYLNMTQAALAGDRLIGMIQPRHPDAEADRPAVYPVGCAGRITAFSETEDGRYLISLSGQCRFRVLEELPDLEGYRRVVPDFAPYRDDMEGEEAGALDRPRLFKALKEYLRLNNITAEWSALEAATDYRLVNTLAMVCPFDPREKQALLEASNLGERGEMVVALIEMAVLERGGSPAN